MPLEKGPVGSDAFGRNIAAEEKAGKPPKQAEAIAYSEAGEKKDSSMDRLDDILADCDKMEKRVDALCASRKDAVLGSQKEDFPYTIKYQGRVWNRTGKIGAHIASGERSAEYSNYSKSENDPMGIERRAWMTISGKITIE